MKKTALVIALVVSVAITITACGTATEKSAAPAETVTVPAETVTVVETQPAPAETQPAPAAPGESVSQENARATAEDYLDSSSFSRSGLIEQLKYEGYSTKDATYAVRAISVDWNEQAAKTAKDYLDSSSFSRSGLIEQLEYEGFTHAQAGYGVNQTGL